MIGTGVIALAFWLVSDPFPFASAEAELSEEIRLDELKAHVYRLASPAFLGRRGAGAARASRHIAAAFERLNLQPAFAGSFFQAIPSHLPSTDRDDGFIGRNVAAVLPGRDPRLRHEWIVVCAHFDHLGKIGNTLFPGADDNATGVAVLLELAEHFALHKEKPRRTLMFLAFDQEEAGLLGSTYFVAHPPRDIRKLKACLTADMLGRSMANVMDEYVFALGSERSARLRALLEEVKPEQGLTVGRVGADLIGTRSDYGPFRDRHVPFLFFSTGQHPDYHAPTDLPERIDYVKLRKIALWMADLTWRLANDTEAPAWDENGLGPDLNEVRTISVLLSRVLEHPQCYPLTQEQRVIVKSIQARLGAIIERGQVTSGERTWLVWTARLLMVTLF
jgi:hypothetical protein